MQCQHCGSATWGSRVCSGCAKLRDQHQASHTIEGHSKKIKLCPVCEEVFK